MGRPPTPIGSYGKIKHIEWGENNWEARTYYRDHDGQSRLVSRRGRSGAAAERELKKALTVRSKIRGASTNRETRLRDVAERWFKEIDAAVVAGDMSPTTARLYRCYLDRHILPAVGALRVSEADVPRLDAFIVSLAEHNGVSVVKTCRSVLSGFMGYAVRHGALEHNPVRDIGRIHGANRKVKARSLSIGECAVWLARLEDDDVAVRRDLPDLTRWLLATGVRIGEAIAVSWDEIDLEAATVEIDHKIIRVTGKGLLRIPRPKSEAGHRTLPLPLFAVRMLERRMIQLGGFGPLFPDSLGGWRDPSNTSRDLREARGGEEFAWVTSHVFRKTCATILDESDLSAREIADQLGHSKVSMTQDNYLGRRLTSRRTADALDTAVGNLA
ncbi:MAG: tyrosine-type recombinase/integrase [Actinomycetota bacterium]|nr:tyrosine-type recombinase/integrase [Actinomycetota bacterium]